MKVLWNMPGNLTLNAWWSLSWCLPAAANCFWSQFDVYGVLNIRVTHKARYATLYSLSNTRRQPECARRTERRMSVYSSSLMGFQRMTLFCNLNFFPSYLKYCIVCAGVVLGENICLTFVKILVITITHQVFLKIG